MSLEKRNSRYEQAMAAKGICARAQLTPREHLQLCLPSRSAQQRSRRIQADWATRLHCYVHA
jgi:hypothetical protein